MPVDARPDAPPAAAPKREATPAANGSGAGGDAREQMQSIFYAVKARNMRVGALLNSVCDIIDADDQMITLGFRHGANLEMAQQPQSLQVVAEAASEVLGRPVKVRCVLDPSVEHWTKRFSRSPLVRAAEQMGARVVSKGEE